MKRLSPARALSLLSNNGDVGGGEVMLLALAHAARQDGYAVQVVAPDEPSECASTAIDHGFEVIRIRGGGRAAYMRGLRQWAYGRRELLWCNGLVPATATAGMADVHRVVHLHRIPSGPQAALAEVARRGALRTVVPSDFMRHTLGYGQTLPNWSPAVEVKRHRSPHDPETPVVIGFLGRLSPEKGIVELATALRRLNLGVASQQDYRMLVAGEPRFVRGRDRTTIEQALQRCGPWVRRGGWMSPAELFSSVDLLVVPSIVGESFGLAATEAMSAGVPLVVSDAGALPEVVGPTHPFVARAGDAEDLARVIASVAADPERTHQATQHARERWRSTYSPEAGAARFRQLLGALTPATVG